MKDHSELINALGYDFKDMTLLYEALRHSSYVNEQPEADMRDNERFEFLGDAVLNLAIGHILMEQHPELKEGDLSRIRANLVNESQLAQIARNLNVGDHIQLGKGERQTEGQDKNSILANAFEALIAAVYLDADYDSALKIIYDHFSDLIDGDEMSILKNDYKSQLQECAQTAYRMTPSYTVVEEIGPDHDKTFAVRLRMLDLVTEGTGKSKKMAEQAAARQAINMLKKDKTLMD